MINVSVRPYRYVICTLEPLNMYDVCQFALLSIRMYRSTFFRIDDWDENMIWNQYHNISYFILYNEILFLDQKKLQTINLIVILVL